MAIIKTTTTRWLIGGTQLCGRLVRDFGLCTENKSLTYLPTNLGIRIRVLAEPYLSLQHCTGWIRQDSGKGIELQGKIMPKAWGKSLHRLNHHRCMQGMHIDCNGKTNHYQVFGKYHWFIYRLFLLLVITWAFSVMPVLEEQMLEKTSENLIMDSMLYQEHLVESLVSCSWPCFMLLYLSVPFFFQAQLVNLI